MRVKTFLFSACLFGLLAPLGWAQSVDLARVVSKVASRTVELPGEFLPFLTVSLHAKLPSYVDRVLVDRGSMVKRRDL
ncbi:MAG: hypothetical protein J2P31_20240, partial [Blastocatellia bacterium]|nr:hypothetical protein [Blastocatellia bacterium]